MRQLGTHIALSRLLEQERYEAYRASFNRVYAVRVAVGLTIVALAVGGSLWLEQLVLQRWGLR